MNQLCFNGKFISADEPLLLASNRGYRYGDGLFETIKIIDGNICLSSFHFERLFSSLSLLQYIIPKHFTAEKLTGDILQLCKKNNCTDLARVRLSVFRGNGGLYDDDKTLQYLIECWPLPDSANQLNDNGLVIGIYQDALKTADKFSGIKSANFLPYSMAALFAKENKWNDCLVLNNIRMVTDSTIANIFIIKENIIYTPGLADGCINGVMRRHLLQSLSNAGYTILEKSLLAIDIASADEIFLTNAINGIRWVKQFDDKMYTNIKAVEIYNCFVRTLWP